MVDLSDYFCSLQKLLVLVSPGPICRSFSVLSKTLEKSGRKPGGSSFRRNLVKPGETVVFAFFLLSKVARLGSRVAGFHRLVKAGLTKSGTLAFPIPEAREVWKGGGFASSLRSLGCLLVGFCVFESLQKATPQRV